MITTVTTTTVTTLGQAASLALAGTIMLLILLANKQIVAASVSDKVRRVSKALNIAIVPLLLVFAITATVKLLTALS